MKTQAQSPVSFHHSTSYDEIPYPAGAYQQSNPDRLETLAKLFGMAPADVRCCLVLELGCADGSNLIPMACALPESTFVGVDLSRRQINAGQEIISTLGLSNIELRHHDIRSVDESFGSFDYVIAHGVYSWVPAEVQEKILTICRDRLKESGVAYVSYNTYPGWRMRGMLRDMMLYHSRKFDDPKMQIDQARALIQWLGESVRSEDNPYGVLLRTELENMQYWQDTYFRHDSLEEINDPVYFHQFIEQAERYGLQYLAEAEFPTMLASNYAAPIDETLNRLGRNIIEMEQYMDFLRNRMFRQTLLCHKGVRLNRSLGPRSLADFHCAASVRPTNAEPELASNKVETFRGPKDMTVSSSQPVVKAALVCLTESWPEAVFFSTLIDRARARLGRRNAGDEERGGHDVEAEVRALGDALLTCFCRGLCELHLHPGQFAVSPGERPRSCPLVRLQASRGNAVTNRRHERVALDSFGQRLVPLLDGVRDRSSLREALTALVADGSLVVSVEDKPIQDSARVREIMATELDKKLRQLGRQALLA